MKLIRSLALTAAGAALVQAGPGITGLGPVRKALMPKLSGLGTPDHVALTFDDGPDRDLTPHFLDELARLGVRATFFLLGSRVVMTQGLAGEIVAAGHEVAVHGWEHRYQILRGPLAVYDDLARSADIITAATGTPPTLFRPPYGVLSGPALVAARKLRLTPVLWTAWGREWMPGATPDTVYRTALPDLKGGATVLLHDSDCTSPAGSALAALGALPRLVQQCDDLNLRIGPLRDHGLR
jgi:peptidoglycan-N-acetylglucosamine deacetylase